MPCLARDGGGAGAARGTGGLSNTSARIALATLGCKVNQYDSQSLAELFRLHGFEVVDFDHPADVYVINTCAVTSTGERKSRQLIRRATRRAGGRVPVLVTGCLAQLAPQTTLAIPGVTAVVGTDRRARLVELARRWVDPLARGEGVPPNAIEVAPGLRRRRPPYEELPVSTFPGRSRATVKVQDGCDEGCTFCIVPHTRGLSRSRPPEAVVAEVRRLVEAGYREVVLSGVHLGLYGRDLGLEGGLAALLGRLESIPGTFRLRLSSLLPGSLDDRLIEWFGISRRLCPHVHLSLQSGDDGVLAAMGRRYRADDVRRTVGALRERRPDLAVSADVIVGFPGETDSAFCRTARLVADLEAFRLHVFPYSPRPGTAAAARKPTVGVRERQRRLRQLRALGDELAGRFHARLVGREVDVLVESPPEPAAGALEGVDEHYVRVRLDARRIPGPGHLVRARVVSAGTQWVQGVAVAG